MQFIGPGDCVLDANQAGSSNFDEALQVQQVIAIDVPVILSADRATFVKGAPGAFNFIADGDPRPTFTAKGAIPIGVRLSGTRLTGTPSIAGSYPITITASNGLSPHATQKFTLTVLPMGITTSSSPTGKLGAKYSATLKAAGGNPPYAWSLVAGSKPLPPGLKLSSAGVISGTPTKKGTYSFTVKVVDTKTKTKPVTQHTVTKLLSIVIS